MKKQIPAFFLALALCVGLAVPAFASNGTISSAPNVTFALPNGASPEASTSDYQLRMTRGVAITDDEKSNVLGYMIGRDSEPTGFSLTTIALPLGTTITISNLRNDWGSKDRQVDIVAINGYSDPDGDGVYDEWIYDFASTPPVVPFTKDSVGFLPSENGRYSNNAYLTGNNKIKFDTQTLPDTVTVTTDYLSEVFGPNTLVVLEFQVWTALSADGLTAMPTSNSGVIVCSISGEKAADTPDTFEFTDLLPWCEKEAVWAAQEGITNGYGVKDKFAPSVDCTQAQILTFLYRADRGEGEAAADDMALAVEWAKEKDMIGDGFDGSAPCTRATAVSYIWQALGRQEATKAASFTDVDPDADYAEAVSWAVEKGVTNGTSDTTFSPDKVCNRGEIVTFLYRAYTESAA